MASLRSGHRVLVVSCLVAVSPLLGVSIALFGICGPFTDVAADAFCPFVLEVFYLGITTGTTPTTYDPAANVSRLQMAAFLSRAVDGTLRRANRRAAANKFWTPQNVGVVGVTNVGGSFPRLLQFDGGDLWLAHNIGVDRVRASDGRLLETWTGADGGFGVLVALGRVLVTGQHNPGKLYMIDPTQPAGAVTTVATPGDSPTGIAFDGARVWTANAVNPGSVSIITPGQTIPWTVTSANVTLGSSTPIGILYDGANIWVTDNAAGTLVKLSSSGSVLQTVTVGNQPAFPVFDGTSIWVPNFGSHTVTVVRASNGAVLQTLTGNGLSSPVAGAFDGERVLITSGGDAVSLWKAADLSALGNFPLPPGSLAEGAASDGLNFWVGLAGLGKLLRF
jgi:hypothetical protein